MEISNTLDYLSFINEKINVINTLLIDHSQDEYLVSILSSILDDYITEQSELMKSTLENLPIAS